MGKSECGLRPIGAYAYAPVGMRKKTSGCGVRMQRAWRVEQDDLKPEYLSSDL